MSSAANDKRGKLEEEFSNRMYDAEASPSQDLWARIDHELTVQENGAYKRSATFYRQLAAACITLLLLAGGVGAWYFSSPAGTEQPLATVAPATSPAPAIILSAPSEEAETAGSVAATAKDPEQEINAVPAPGKMGESATETVPAAATIAAAPAKVTNTRQKAATAGTTLPQPGAGSVPVLVEAAGTVTLAEITLPQAVEKESSVSLIRSLRQTIAALSAAEQKNGNNPVLLQNGLAGTDTEAKANSDFRKLNEQVRAKAKQMEEEQKSKLLAFNEEATSKKDAKKDKGEGSSRWSLGMAYAPGYFDQNIGLPAQNTMDAASRQSLVPNQTQNSSISSLYMNEARDEYAENTDPGFSFGFEVKTGVKLSKRLKLLTGLGFLQNTTRSKSSYLVQQGGGFASFSGPAANDPSPIFVPSLSSDFAASSMFVVKVPEYKVNHRYRYLTVPLELQYAGSIGKDWFWYGGAGVAANMLIQTTILSSAAEVKDVDYDLKEESPFRKMHWSGRMSGGVGKRLADNMSVTVGPEFRSYFNNLLAEPENAQVPQGRPYAVGLNMAVNYDLNAGKKSR